MIYMKYSDIPALRLDYWLEECDKVDKRQILEPWIDIKLLENPDKFHINLCGWNRLLRMDQRAEVGESEWRTGLDTIFIDTLEMLTDNVRDYIAISTFIELESRFSTIGFHKSVLSELVEKYPILKEYENGYRLQGKTKGEIRGFENERVSEMGSWPTKLNPVRCSISNPDEKGKTKEIFAIC